MKTYVMMHIDYDFEGYPRNTQVEGVTFNKTKAEMYSESGPLCHCGEHVNWEKTYEEFEA